VIARHPDTDTDRDDADGDDAPGSTSLREAALVDFRRFRRRRWLSHLDWVDALYRAYLTAIALGVIVFFLSAAAHDAEVGPATVGRVADHGPAWLGLGLAIAVAAGLRSGGRGGPLALEAAEVRYVLMAPIDRRRALGPPAFRLLRFAVFVGVVAGAVAGQYAYRRLPGSPISWVLAAVAYALVAVTGFVGSAFVASGHRLGPVVVAAAVVAVVGWSVLDVVLDVTTSPLTLAGGLGIWPIEVHALDLVGLVPFAALAAVAWRSLGGISLERAERRSALVGQLRFAVTLQDVRTVVLLRRQLTQEHGRRHPLIRVGGMGRRPARFPVWRRGWQGVARWPTLRFVRIAAYGAAAGVALVGVWDGTTALLVPAGLVLWLAGLDAVEPLAQDADHPSLVESLPKEAAVLRIRQLAVPVVVMVGVGLVGCAAALAFGHARLVAEVGLPTVIPAALATACAAAVSVVKPSSSPGVTEVLQPELAGIKQAFSAARAPILASLAGVPVLVARHVADADTSALRATLAGCAIPLAASLIALLYLRMRERARAWWERQLTMASSGSSMRDAARREAEARVEARVARSRARRAGVEVEEETDGG
jgi:hypothetical protein